MSARIERLAGYATLQGLPIYGYRRFGVPPGGAFDQESYRLGCALAGNEEGSLAIELSNAAIEVVFGTRTRVAVTGGERNAAFDVGVGETLKVDAPRTGVRVYLSVAGGLLPDGIDSLLGRSGHRLAIGDVLEHAEVAPSGRTVQLADPPSSLSSGSLRMIGHAPIAGLVVSFQSDRTGIRLDGLAQTEPIDLPSEPACVGAVQATPSGQLIAIGPDGPTVGGYPKVGYICSADLDRLGQLRPGDEITLESIELDAAREMARARRSELEAKIQRLRLPRSL